MKQQDKLRLELLIKQLDRGDGVLDRNALEQVKEMYRAMGYQMPK